MNGKPTSAQVYASNNRMIDEQDRVLDEILLQVDQTKTTAGDINREVDKQQVLMGDMKQGMNRVDFKMKKANEKIARVIQEQSYCRLYVIIILEIALMFLLIFLQ